MLATRHMRTALSGSNPTPTRIAVGIATAVPKPAMPSMKLPNPQTMMSAWTRRSSVISASPARIVAIAPEATVTA